MAAIDISSPKSPPADEAILPLGGPQGDAAAQSSVQNAPGLKLDLAPSAADATWMQIVAVAGLACGALVVVIYWDTLQQLRAVWDKDPSYSHGYLVPVASLAFAVLAWQRGRPDFASALTAQGMPSGVAEILLGLGLHAASWLLTLLVLDVISLICVVRGLLLLIGGPSVNQKFGFAALFLIFMAPLPPPVYQAAALTMQHFVSIVSTACLDLLGIAAYRQGYFIHLADYSMEVGEACSGLRGMMLMLALSVALGELFQSRLMGRAVLLILALPMAIAANCLRVTLSGIIMVFLGRRWAEGVFHTLEGLATTLIAAGALFVVALALARFEQPNNAKSTGQDRSKQPGSGT